MHEKYMIDYYWQIYEQPKSIAGDYCFWLIPKGMGCSEENCKAKFKEYEDAEDFARLWQWNYIG